jgi:hypothetical protein
MVKKTIASIGKHIADPIEANFFKGRMVPHGNLARLLRQPWASPRKVGATLSNISITKSLLTRSEASERSMVDNSPLIDPSLANSWFTF